MPKLTIDTRESLYEPIEIEINGQVYEVKSLNTEFFEKMNQFDEMVINEGKLEGNALFMHHCIGVPMKIAKKLDIRVVNKVKLFLGEAITKSAEKNVVSGGKEETK